MEVAPARPVGIPSDTPAELVSSPGQGSRRHWLQALLMSLAPAAVAAADSSAPDESAAWDIDADVDPGSLLNKLVRRTAIGPTSAEYTLANQLGYQGYLEYQLNYLAIDDSAMEAKLAPYRTLTMTPSQLFVESVLAVVDELLAATFRRSLYTRRQLFERMCEMWTDHFNIDITKGDCAFLKTIDDKTVIRRHALGTFPQLLNASAQSAAMLIYLDNYVSNRVKPNENYARELLELHTMGVDGGYTQQDVENVARCFTGWSIYNRGAAPQLVGSFQFKPEDHDQGAKTVLGHHIPAGGGVSDGLTVLQILAEHPSTARFIASKLVRWLLGEGAPRRVIDDVAATYTATRGDIKAMIRTTLKPGYLASAPRRYKRPYHLYIGALRALNAEVQDTWVFMQWLKAAGHLPYHWTTPDGYPDSVDYWGGLVMERWNFGAGLPAGQVSGLVLHVDELFPQRMPQPVVDKLDLMLFGGEMPIEHKNRIRAYLSQAEQSIDLIRDSVGLGIAVPDYQWY